MTKYILEGPVYFFSSLHIYRDDIGEKRDYEIVTIWDYK